MSDGRDATGTTRRGTLAIYVKLVFIISGGEHCPAYESSHGLDEESTSRLSNQCVQNCSSGIWATAGHGSLGVLIRRVLKVTEADANQK